MCAEASKRTRVPMLPTLPYGCSLGHNRRWAGTLAVQPVTLIHFVKDIGDWAYHSGVRRLFIVNTHVTNAAPLRRALEMLRSELDDLMVALIDSATLSARVRAVHFSDAEDGTPMTRRPPSCWRSRPNSCARRFSPPPTIRDRTTGLVFAAFEALLSLGGANPYSGRPVVCRSRQDIAG